MTSNGVSSQMDQLDLSDTDTEDLFASPSRVEQKKANKSKDSISEPPKTPAFSTRSTANPGESRYGTEEARETALRKELAGIRNINQVVEGVTESLDKAKDNMDVRLCPNECAGCFSESWNAYLNSSPFPRRFPTPVLFYKLGHASCRKPNIISVLYSTHPGMVPRKTLLIRRMSRC